MSKLVTLKVGDKVTHWDDYVGVGTVTGLATLTDGAYVQWPGGLYSLHMTANLTKVNRKDIGRMLSQ